MGIDPNQGASMSTAGATAVATPQAATASFSSGGTSKPTDQSRRKRKIFIDLANDEDAEVDAEQPPKPKKARVKKDATEEKRLRKFRAKAPTGFAAVYHRATSQRFFVLSRTPSGTANCPEAHFEISGSTGNIYNVCIGRRPTCDCPHARAGNQCKHTLFVLSKVLRAKPQYVYQLALLSSELRDTFAAAPSPAEDKKEGDEDKNRKAMDGDCPICFDQMESGEGKEPLVWCKAACGQNLHKQCFDMWASTKRSGKVPCPYCRSDWQVDEDATVDVTSIKRSGKLNKDGYVNVADQLGISTHRDHSTYSRWWSGHSDDRGRGWGSGW